MHSRQLLQAVHDGVSQAELSKHVFSKQAFKLFILHEPCAFAEVEVHSANFVWVSNAGVVEHGLLPG